MYVKGRDATFDIAKFIAIFMVIFWHCYPAGWHARNWIETVPVNLIIGCNMPLFFLISGYFSRKMYVDRDVTALIVRLIGNLWPVFIFSFVDIGVQCWTNVPEFAILQEWVRVLLTCFWFFCCLSLCELLTFVSFWISRKRDFLVGAILGIIFLLFWTIPLGIWYFVAMVPFYWGGIFLLPKVYCRPNMKYIGVVILSLYVLISMLEGDITTNGMGFYWDRMRLSQPSLAGLYRMFARYAMGALGSVGILMTLNLIVCVVPTLKRLSVFGTTTLGIYFLHRYIVKEWYRFDSSSTSSVALRVCLATAIFVVCHFVVLLTQKSEVVRCFFWGPGRYVKRFCT